MDVVQAAWRGAGQPDPGVAGVGEGVCARCGGRGVLCPVGKVVSGVFTGFDTWQTPGGAGLCAGCAWAYRCKALRAGAHLVTTVPGLQSLGREQVLDLLASGPVGDDQALVIPLRPGRKHLLPDAGWGQVTSDHAAVRWGQRDAVRLRTLRWLRGLGFGTRMLAAPAPAYPVLRRIDSGQWPAVLQAWASLAEWRVPNSPWWAVGLWTVASAQSGEQSREVAGV